MTFDPTEYQQSPNGPLNDRVVERIIAIKQKSGLSYAALGKQLGMSGTFLHNIVNRSVNVGTQHVQRIATAIELLESPSEFEKQLQVKDEILTHSFHLRPSLQIAMDLPLNLTEREASRLAKFIQSLPVN